jgi:hypothetical protein
MKSNLTLEEMRAQQRERLALHITTKEMIK